jgi:K+-transporting ATPase ATPase C chain
MMRHLRVNLFLLLFTLLLCAVVYPLALVGIGRVFFHDRAEGSLLTDARGQAIGSRLIAQPFTGDEYFQPRPSAASYNAAASGASNWAASNYLLRDRVARQLGPIVKYGGGPKKGQPVGPDIEAWFQKDEFNHQPGIVSQWADLHPTLAQNWVKADKLNAEYVGAWANTHKADVDHWIKDNPATPEPKPDDLAGVFFKSYSAANPGTFPGAVGDKDKHIEPVQEGTDIQAAFFDLWLHDHPDADLEPVPADMVTASGSGLDPHITLKSALYQLDRVAGKWAELTKRDQAPVRKEIEALLNEKAEAPLGGLVGVKLVNVLETNLALRDHFGGHRAVAEAR